MSNSRGAPCILSPPTFPLQEITPRYVLKITEALVYEMLEGKAAFRGSSMEQLNIRIMRASHEQFTQASPAHARQLVRACLSVDVEKRVPSKEAAAFPWFTSSPRGDPTAE